ncbi:hypothetical protein PG984_008359 [Apiospora sp. TS-2023a]
MVPRNVAYPRELSQFSSSTQQLLRFLHKQHSWLTAGYMLRAFRALKTGRYCDTIESTSANQTSYPDEQACSYCELALQQNQLSSPFGYNVINAQSFASITTSCGELEYGYATPTSYALNATSSPVPTPVCQGTNYILRENDTCVSISKGNNIPTYDLIVMNRLNVGCDNLPAPGGSLCLPVGSICTTYQLESNDTCESLVSSWNVTWAQVLSWNPMISPSCTNLASWRGWNLCSSSPSGHITVGAGNGATSAVPVPTDAQGQSNKRCAQWYYVQTGDYCASISLKFSISIDDFYFLNPQVDRMCTNIWTNTSYCVKAVGNIGTYTGYPITTAPTTFSRPPTSSTFIPIPVESPAAKPTAPGTMENCYYYESGFSESPYLENLTEANSCESWSIIANVTVGDLLEWNPSLSRSNCELQSEYSYCIQLWELNPSITYPYDFCAPPDPTRIPATSLQPPLCGCYTNIAARDRLHFNCSTIYEVLSMTPEQLISLNPWIGPDCDTGIWSQLNDEGFEQICVLSGSAIPTSTRPPLGSPTETIGGSSSGTSTVASKTTTTTTAEPAIPTQPGASKDCKKWHQVVSGDGCWSIANDAGITLDEFYRLNPGVGTDCSALWLGYAGQLTRGPMDYSQTIDARHVEANGLMRYQPIREYTEGIAAWRNHEICFLNVDAGLSDTDVKDPVWGFVKDLEHHKREDLLPSHDLRAIDDPSLYRATHRQVREHFLSWGLNDLKTKLHPNVNPEEKYMSTGFYSPECHRPRYQYCLVVDDLCMESLDQAGGFFPAVKLLILQWMGPTVEEEGVDGEQGPESHPTDEEAEWWFEQDVGWTYMSVRNYVDRYTHLGHGRRTTTTRHQVLLKFRINNSFTMLSRIFLLFTGLAAALPGMQLAKAPRAGATITDMIWRGQIEVGGPEMNFSGTIQEVVAQIKQINPDFPAGLNTSLSFKQDDKPNDGHQVQCGIGGDAGDHAYVNDIWAGIDYLHGIPGNCGVNAGPRNTCSRVSCSWNSGIWLCSDNGLILTQVFPVIGKTSNGHAMPSETLLIMIVSIASKAGGRPKKTFAKAGRRGLSTISMSMWADLTVEE